MKRIKDAINIAFALTLLGLFALAVAWGVLIDAARRLMLWLAQELGHL